MGNQPAIGIGQRGNCEKKPIAPMGLLKTPQLFLPSLNAYGINVRLLLAPLGAQGW